MTVVTGNVLLVQPAQSVIDYLFNSTYLHRMSGQSYSWLFGDVGCSQFYIPNYIKQNVI